MPENPEIWKAAAMACSFDKIQKLPEPLAGAPNFHRIPGYKVYCTGQPTAAGFKNILEKAKIEAAKRLKAQNLVSTLK